MALPRSEGLTYRSIICLLCTTMDETPYLVHKNTAQHRTGAVHFFGGSPYLLGVNVVSKACPYRFTVSAEHDDARIAYQLKSVAQWQVGGDLLAHGLGFSTACVNTS